MPKQRSGSLKERVHAGLRREITSGDLSAGDQLPTMRSLAERFDTSVCTVHNAVEMLEEEGYLCKPHVSAGRVPTDSGYRLYVDKMEINDTLSRDMIEKINNRIG